MAQMIYRQVLTHLFMRFDCDAVDKFGRPLTHLPVADHSSLHLSPPADLPIHMRYKVIDADSD
jgi:hypothetical protein